jgi:hypothetical protein
MADIGRAHRSFPLADVLSVTTGTLLSRRRMDGVCDLVAYLTDTARTELLRQHPILDGLIPPAGLDHADLYSWLVATEETHGLELTIRCPHPHPTPREIAAFDQVMAGFKESTARLVESFAGFAETVANFSESLQDLAAALEADPDPGQALDHFAKESDHGNGQDSAR